MASEAEIKASMPRSSGETLREKSQVMAEDASGSETGKNGRGKVDEVESQTNGEEKECSSNSRSDDGENGDEFKDAQEGAEKTETLSSSSDKLEQEQKVEKATDASSILKPETTSKKPQDSSAKDAPEPSEAALGTSPSKIPDIPITHTRAKSNAHASEWSHQALAPHAPDEVVEEEDEWQEMPAVADYDLYDDDDRLVARGTRLQGGDDDEAVYAGLGGAGKGYTRVQIDEDAQSATSMDEDTGYLFKEPPTNAAQGEDDDEQRDALAQLEATKDLLTEGQRIAYVGVARLTMFQMAQELETAVTTKGTKKEYAKALESMKKWGQQMMVRLYAHMDIDSAEQVMIEQLAEHGVQPADLVPPLMQNARVQNPMADEEGKKSMDAKSPSTDGGRKASTDVPPLEETKEDADADLPEVRTPSQLPHTKKIDLDLRWTVLCDLFLVLISDSHYDSRSRLLLERVGAVMDITWVQICRFEKRVIDALEMQEEDSKETWDEADHMENRRKLALKKRYMMMGLATVGGGLVIGLSAGLLAPVIGAGLAAGFTTIGVSGTSAFLGGTGGAALIASGATAAGGTIGARASSRRFGSVKTFEYRPLHNNKRVNLIVTLSGWMNGKVDDVRLPFSTVDPIMGDMYSVLWEPEMLQSMGDTINILATEALTQGLQQVLASTVLTALMASIQLPIVLTKLSYLIDNPWAVSLERANGAGLVLADSLMARNLGNRPITLVGFSLGSRVIFAALKELASKGAYGLVQNVYLYGSPVVANRDEYLRARTVVSGRFVNGYSSADWILGYLFRATSGGIMRIAGLAPVENVPGVENIDVTPHVNGHMAYRAAMPKLMRDVGWEVESDEFTEIEDPDPENHAKRQRELIKEIDEARKEAETAPKSRFSFFKRGAQKKGWETYDANGIANSEKSPDMSPANDHLATGGVFFDVDAIRAELASEQIEVRQLESTLPPMQLDLSAPTSPLPPDTATSASSSTKSTPKLQPAKNKLARAHTATGSTSSAAGNGMKSPTDLPTRKVSGWKSLMNLGSPKTVEPKYDEYDETNDVDAAHAHSSNSNTTINGGHGHSKTEPPPPSSSSHHNDHETTSPLQMTFDTSFSAPPTTTIDKEKEKELPSLPASSERPGLQSSKTMPAYGLGIERNAWADEDEFGHGHGAENGEIKMTFE